MADVADAIDEAGAVEGGAGDAGRGGGAAPAGDLGASWDRELYGSLQRSRRLAWLLAGGASVVAVLALLALVAVVPLKEWAPYVVTVDRTTGYMEATRALRPGTLSQEEAIAKFFLVHYVEAREGYDVTDLAERYEKVTVNSVGEALRQYRALFVPGNPQNPTQRYGRDATVVVHVKAISFLDTQFSDGSTGVSVRFANEMRSEQQTQMRHWVSTIRFKFTKPPQQMRDLIRNPLGFRVVSYRRNQEVLAEQEK